MDVDDHRNGVPADDPKPRLFTDTRASDGGFQGAVAKLAAFFRQKLREKLWTIRSREQFCTNSSFEFEETEWFEIPKPSAQVFRFNFNNIC